MKSAVFDLETTSLAGVGDGMLLCGCVRPLANNKTKTFRLDDYKFEPSPDFGMFTRQEEALVRDLVLELSLYDLLIGHNIDSFDLHFLRTRAYVHKVPCAMTPFTFDTMRSFRRVGMRTVLNRIGKPTASMDMVADFLGLDQLKTKIYPVDWWQSIWGSDAERLDALNEIVDHCVRDVRMNAQIYDALLPLDEKAVIKRWR
jgi:uncharacterized protein YprB with RNaseH-like and TPR domain